MGAKADIIPEEWKPTIDSLLQHELFAANRSFAALHPALTRQVQAQAQKPPEQFNRELEERWEWHDMFYEQLLEPALHALINGLSSAVSPQRAGHLRAVYATMDSVDMATLPVSASIKKHAENWADTLAKKFRLSPQDQLRLISIPQEPFYMYYERDHVAYALALVQQAQDAQQQRAALLEKYHASDEAIFAGRWKRFEHYLSRTAEELETEVAARAFAREDKVSHFYFTLGKPSLQALTRTLVFDNCQEYDKMYGLVGISGFVLRKRVLEWLHEEGLPPATNNIYEAPRDTVLEQLRVLEDRRKHTMNKPVQTYTQTDLTCGACCIMMAEHYFGLGELSRANEHAIHAQTTPKHYPGNHFSALALHAGKRGLETVLLHEEKTMFKRPPSFSKSLFDELVAEYSGYIEAAGARLRVENGVPVTPAVIRELLAQDYLVLAAGMAGTVMHTVLATGYTGNAFIVNDPLSGQREAWSSQRMEQYLQTPVGRWLLAVRADQSAAHALLSHLGQYDAEASSFREEHS
jgi:hypothetical protein